MSEKWIKPAILFAIAGTIFSAGITYQQVTALEADSKDAAKEAFSRAIRINTLENNYAHIKDSLKGITSYINERREERERGRNIQPPKRD